MAAIIYKTADDIALMRHSCELVGKTHGIVASHLKPGVKTIRLDEIAEEFIRDNKAIPSFKGYRDTFPASLCISITLGTCPYIFVSSFEDHSSANSPIADDGVMG